MAHSIGVIAPIMAIIALGFCITHWKFFSGEQIATLNRFVVSVAAPALLFRNVALTEIPSIPPWGLWLSYYGAMFGCYALAFMVASLVFRERARGERVILSFGGSFSNTVMLGIPIILTAFGAAASLPLFLILAFHGLLIFSATIILMELSANPSMALTSIFPKLGRAMANQQVMLGLLAGVLWNFTGLGLAPGVDTFLDLLGQSTIPLALVVVGGVLAQTQWRPALNAALFSSLFKLVVLPIMVFALAQYVFALPPLWVATITLLAAMPSGVFTSVFAIRYETAQQEASSTIVLSTVLGAFSVSVWLLVFSEFLIVR